MATEQTTASTKRFLSRLGAATLAAAAACFILSCGGGGTTFAPNLSLPGQDGGVKVYSPPVVRPAAESFAAHSTASTAASRWVENVYSPVGGRLPGSVYQNQSLAAWAREIEAGINAARLQRGLNALAVEAHLGALAQAHARDMALRDYFAHDTPDGLTPWQRLSAIGAPYYATAAENAAKGQETAAEVVSGWLGSEKHRENMLKPGLTHMGIGVYFDATDSLMPVHAIADFAGFTKGLGGAGW